MASQSVYVDLDLKGNELQNVGDASAGTSAPNLAQVEALITTGGWTPAAAATAAGLGLTSTGSTIDVAAGQGLEVDDTGLWVNLGSGIGLSSGGGVAVKTGTGLTIGADDLVAVVPAYVQGLIDTSILAIDYPVDSVVGTAPITASTDAATGVVTVGINATALDFPVDSVDATAPITVTETVPGEVVVGLDVAALVPILDTAGVATDAEVSAIAGTKANSATAVTAGAGLIGGGTLAAAFSIDVANTDGSITVAADGIQVADGGLTAAKFAYGAVDNLALGANLYALIDVEKGSTDPATAGSGNVLTFNGSQWVGQTPATVDYPVENVLGTTGQVVVTENPADTFVVSLDPAITGAITTNTADIAAEEAARIAADGVLQANIDLADAAIAQEALDRAAADTALTTRIDGISITGAGAATVTEDTPDHFTVSVDSLTLSNTYSGTTGVDTGTITTEIAPAIAEAGDLYVNTLTGQAFIYDGDSWTELAAAAAGVLSVASGDASLTVTNGGGPAVDIVLDAALKTAISTSTTTNGVQDTAIAALQTTVAALDLIDHAAAVSGNSAIAVDAATQAVSVVVDPLSTELTVGATGLTLNLTGYATDTELSAEVTARTDGDAALQDAIDAEALTRQTNDNALQASIDALELTDSTQTADIAAIEGVNTTQDAAILALQNKHVTLPFNLAGGDASQVVVGPVGAVVTVRDSLGCVITISVCEAAGSYTLNANTAVSGTISFG